MADGALPSLAALAPCARLVADEADVGVLAQKSELHILRQNVEQQYKHICENLTRSVRKGEDFRDGVTKITEHKVMSTYTQFFFESHRTHEHGEMSELSRQLRELLPDQWPHGFFVLCVRQTTWNYYVFHFQTYQQFTKMWASDHGRAQTLKTTIEKEALVVLSEHELLKLKNVIRGDVAIDTIDGETFMPQRYATLQTLPDIRKLEKMMVKRMEAEERQKARDALAREQEKDKRIRQGRPLLPSKQPRRDLSRSL